MDASAPHVEVEIDVPGEARYLSFIGRIGEDLAYELQGYPGDLAALAHQVNQVLTEAAANAIEHANRGDPAKLVRVSIILSREELLIRVYDQGDGFDIDRVPPPDPERLQERGRGLFIIRSLMDSVSYRPADGGNVLELRKRLR